MCWRRYRGLGVHTKTRVWGALQSYKCSKWGLSFFMVLIVSFENKTFPPSLACADNFGFDFRDCFLDGGLPICKRWSLASMYHTMVTSLIGHSLKEEQLTMVSECMMYATGYTVDFTGVYLLMNGIVVWSCFSFGNLFS